MVIVMKPGTPEQEWKKIKENLEGRGYQINEIVGSGQTILGVIGDRLLPGRVPLKPSSRLSALPNPLSWRVQACCAAVRSSHALPRIPSRD